MCGLCQTGRHNSVEDEKRFKREREKGESWEGRRKASEKLRLGPEKDGGRDGAS